MALVVVPTYPAAGTTCTLSLTAATGTAWVFELTSKPTASALPLGFLTTTVPSGKATPQTSRGVLDLDVATDEFTPDVAGEYGFTAYDWRFIAGSSSYRGDPCGETRYEFAASQMGTVYVGDYSDIDVVTKWGSGATIRMTVVNATVRVVSLVNATDEHARVACLSTNLTAPLAALVGVGVDSLGTQLESGVNDLLAKYATHRVLVGGHPNTVHLAADATNVVQRGAANSQMGAADLLSLIHEAYVGHATESIHMFGAGGWHVNDDLKSLPVVGEGTSLGAAWLLMTDLRERCYERHRVLCVGSTPAVHDDIPDTTNVLTAALPLDTLVATLLDELLLANPTAAAGESDGLLRAASMYGGHSPLQEPV